MSTQRSHHRFLHVPRLTGLRRPSQSASATSHGQAQLVNQVEESLHQPHHYHAYNNEMPTQRQAHSQRVRFSDDTAPSHAQHNRSHSSSNGSSNTHSNPVSTSSSLNSFELEPTSAVAEWCHQMHVIQSRRYDWCQACYPRPAQVAPAAHQPDDEETTMASIEARRAQMVDRVRKERQAAHAYQ